MFQFIRLSRYLLIGLILLVVATPLASVQGQECSPPECTNPTPEVPPGIPSAPTTNHTIKPAWEGFTDGRLNPAMDEYYSVWCQDNVVRVLRGVPTTALVDDIPIESVNDLNEGGSLIRDNGLTLTRNADTITLSGSNGNLPMEGKKSFSLSDCLNRNGNLPEEQQASSTDEDTSSEIVNQSAIGDEFNYIETCTSIPRFPCDYDGDGDYDLLDLFLAILTYVVEVLGTLFVTVCGTPVAAAAGVFIIPAGWAKWRRRKG